MIYLNQKEASSSDSNFSRQIARKLRIEDITKGTFVQEQDNMYLRLQKGDIIARVSLIAHIVGSERTGNILTLLVDDGSGSVVVRFFDQSKLEKYKVGEVIHIIGRIRSYNEEMYISPEISTKVEALWIKVRNLSLVKKQDTVESMQEVEKKEQVEVQELEEEEHNLLPSEKLRALISQMDQGEGVLLEDVIEKSAFDNTEDIISKMLEKGDIFENSPGKVKVL